jgi:hypothetical protein
LVAKLSVQATRAMDKRSARTTPAEAARCKALLADYAAFFPDLVSCLVTACQVAEKKVAATPAYHHLPVQMLARPVVECLGGVSCLVVGGSY